MNTPVLRCAEVIAILCLGVAFIGIANACNGINKGTPSTATVTSSASCSNPTVPAAMNSSACCFSNTICGYNNQASNANKYFYLKTDTCSYNSATCATGNFNLAACSCVTTAVPTTTPVFVTTTAAPGVSTCAPAPADSTWYSSCIALNRTAPSASNASNYYFVSGCSFTQRSCPTGYVYSSYYCSCRLVYRRCIYPSAFGDQLVCQSDNNCNLFPTMTVDLTAPTFLTYQECAASIGLFIPAPGLSYRAYSGFYNPVNYTTNAPIFICMANFGASYHCLDYPFSCVGGLAVAVEAFYPGGYSGCCDFLKNSPYNANAGSIMYSLETSLTPNSIGKCQINTVAGGITPNAAVPNQFFKCTLSGSLYIPGPFNLCQTDGKCDLLSQYTWTPSATYTTYAACQAALVSNFGVVMAAAGGVGYTITESARGICRQGNTNTLYVVDYPGICFSTDKANSANSGFLSTCNDAMMMAGTTTLTYSTATVGGKTVSVCTASG